jgi:ribonuclease E
MLDSERNNHETDIDEAAGHSAGAAPAPVTPTVPAALFQPPQVLFQPPAPLPAPTAGDREPAEREPDSRPEPDADSGRTTRRSSRTRAQSGDAADDEAGTDAESGRTSRRTRSRGRTVRVRDAAPDDEVFSAESAGAVAEAEDADGETTVAASVTGTDEAEETGTSRRRRRRNSRTRGRADASADDDVDGQGSAGQDAGDDGDGDDPDADGDGDAAGSEAGASGRRRRRKRRRGAGDGDALSPDDPPDTVVHVREPHNPADDVRAIKGSTRLEAKKQRRREGRESGRRRPPVITESEFLARRESVERTMVVRQRGDRTQIAVLEDGVLVEHYVNRTTHASYVGNVYLGKVQNVLPSMEAAFVDIGKGRNAVLYAGEVNFDASGLEGQPKRIESALKPGQAVIVQVTKDPVGHKGARLTSQVSLPGRYLVYVPGASMTGISRKLPDTERTRLKQILKKVTPEHAGVIVRTAAEGAAEAELDRDITRLAAQWETIEKKAKTATAPALLYGEPDLTVRVVRDVFNEDFHKLIVSGDEGWEIIDEYVRYVAPHLAERISRWDTEDNEDADEDVFAAYRIDEQLAKAMERKVWLPSGGSLVIDRTEAMTVIDVNTGKFTGQGGNLEETVTRNNLEAAEEIVRQLRLRDVGGIIVIDFIDMVLESNRELVLRRLLECLARDRTKHQVAEVTSLGLVQMTRKRVGAGLLEAFSQQCECCNGRGVIVTLDVPPEPAHRASAGTTHRPVPVPAPPSHVPDDSHAAGNGNGKGNGSGNGKGGYANGRRNGRRDNDRDDERSTRDSYQDTAQDSASRDSASRGGSPAETSPSDATQVVTTAASASANGAPGDSGTGAGSNGTRPRRSTSAGTAFATAVIVEDSPPLVQVVTTVPPVTDPAQSGFSPAATGGQAATETTDPSAPPVRRTRAGSAVARVTVVTDPAPAPAPAAEPKPEETPAASTDAVEAPADPVATVETESPAPMSDWSAPVQAPAEAEAAIEAPAPTLEVTEASAPETEAPAMAAAEPEWPASLGEPTIVSASVFDAPQATPPAEPQPDAVGEPAPEATAQAEAAPESVIEAPAAEPTAADRDTPVDQDTPEPLADAVGEHTPDAAVAEVASESVHEAPAAEPTPADQGTVEAPTADAAGEPTPTAEPETAASAEGEGEGEAPTWA